MLAIGAACKVVKYPERSAPDTALMIGSGSLFRMANVLNGLVA